MLKLHKFSSHTPREKEMPSRQIAVTDEAIDKLVYELSPAEMIHGLTGNRSGLWKVRTE